MSYQAKFDNAVFTGETLQSVLDQFGAHIKTLKTNPPPDAKLQLYKDGESLTLSGTY